MGSGEWIALGGLIFLALGFLADRVLKPWRARRLAEAKERGLLALLNTKQMQDALRVLVGEPGDPEQGLQEREGLGKRMARLEEQFHPNGGDSARDVLNRVEEKVDALDGRVATAERVVGEAVSVVATFDQRITDLGQQQGRQHEENVRRLHELEDNDQAQEVFREWALGLLRDKYDIDLLPDE